MIPYCSTTTTNGASRFTDAGAYSLLADQPTESGMSLTRADRFSGRRHNLMIEMIATHLGTCGFFFSSTPVTVYRNTGERDLIPAAQARATDLLQWLIT